MRSTTRSILATATAIGLLAIPAMATASDTDVSFTVASSSSLTVSQDTSSATVDDGGSNPVFDALSANTITGTLPATTVTDQRGLLSGGWTVSVVASGDWENQSDASQTVPAANGRVYLDAVDANALESALGGLLTGMALTGGEFNADTGNDLSSSYTLLTGTTVTSGSVEYTPAIDIEIPADTPAGTYTTTVTQTVS